MRNEIMLVSGDVSMPTGVFLSLDAVVEFQAYTEMAFFLKHELDKKLTVALLEQLIRTSCHKEVGMLSEKEGVGGYRQFINEDNADAALAISVWPKGGGITITEAVYALLNKPASIRVGITTNRRLVITASNEVGDGSFQLQNARPCQGGRSKCIRCAELVREFALRPGMYRVFQYSQMEKSFATEYLVMHDWSAEAAMPESVEEETAPIRRRAVMPESVEEAPAPICSGDFPQTNRALQDILSRTMGR